MKTLVDAGLRESIEATQWFRKVELTKNMFGNTLIFF
jgi:hypothetical protein